MDQRHAEMVYVPEKKTYFVKDLRSVNGVCLCEHNSKNIDIATYVCTPITGIRCLRVGVLFWHTHEACIVPMACVT